MRTLSRTLFLLVVPAMVASFLVLVAVALLGGLGLEVLRAPLLPSPAGLCGVLVGLLPGILVWILPVSVGVGLIHGLGRLRREGGWHALQAAGVGGRLVAHRLLPLLAGVALLTGVLGSWLQPIGLQFAEDALFYEAGPVAGRPVTFDRWTFAVREAQGADLSDVMLAGVWGEAEVLGGANRGRLESTEGVLHLEDGRLYRHGPIEAVIDFDSLDLSLESGSARGGGGRHPAYQRAIELKRLSWPLAVFALLLACLPLVLSARSWVPGVALLFYWAAVRTCDHLAPATGALVSAFLPPLMACFFAAATWSRWGER